MIADDRLEEIARLKLDDAAATERLGADLAMILRAGDVVALCGDLGAGKSTLARAAIRHLAGDPSLEVPSPTYTLVQAYETTPKVAHFDLYRIGGDDELDELGFDEIVEAGVALVEWPQNAPRVMAEASLVVSLEMAASGGRVAVLTGRGATAERARRSLAIRTFLAEAGLAEAERRRFFGDASTRRYETVHTGTTEPLILMDAPHQADGPPVRDGLPYSRIAHLAEDVVPFVAVADALAGAGFAAPAIHRADLERGLLLIEHLGEGTLLDDAGRPVAERYEAAVLCLADLHETDWPAELPVAGGAVYTVPAFDPGAMAIEVDLLPDWYLPRARGRAATPEERATFAGIWSDLFAELRAAETNLVLRDFHSPNVIWRPRETGRRRIGLIDFQDAVIGPSAYDVAALAQDARVDVPEALEMRLREAYVARRREGDPGFDADGFERAYAIMAAQRASKVLGIFVRLLERDGKPQYLRHIPRIKTYLGRTLGHPSLAALKALYAAWGVLDDEAS
ncbi:tRNA (adenosine(37)-N6)-threonylcarbamoyltransferase complex ATPase subunit type 1 TsaE [Aurantimonas sp. HBX-1]|uniref:tRNA (adenosine(37)-N6)-threonylcarbamoyltransferase complex ATPase subunit type 1 TsaE n=1 Tax=Aurantimonas sp. HBX-1 TaxID=2906072 RepID=UPI001F00A5E2|nr:tRNA (adenosine(37)-N6)-threonylcarbamoyltransferase complex ATPase subunit type 1 TsaE [Aurantimonas sp. HBX-1]UIJ71676.1 tRNA (adenosine(37)-N6)-threonylcarbamoyltransferase complex ATPase subunit type 1 TsaE [Aurantimonas sp. HBX-1]